MACTHCGCKETVVNDARGETVCTGCGRVLAESVMVDMLTFAGGGKMSGQFIDSRTGTIRGFASFKRESSELTLARGFNNLERVADRLAMSPALVEASKRLYRLASNRNFTLGRNNYYVVSACLYAICRKEKAAQMLIDFSDALMVPVKTLAKVFMKLTRSLCLQVPCVDPSLFMERFAHNMNLKNGRNDYNLANKVAMTGVRLVQAMTRDWLVTGRRPLGLCAASLLVAARYHGCKLNSDDINELFRISHSTVDKRLREFSSTAVAQIMVKDFEDTDLEAIGHRALPPCVTNPTKKRRLAFLEDDNTGLNSVDKPVHLLMAQLEDANALPSITGHKEVRSEEWLEAHLQRQAIENAPKNYSLDIPLTSVTSVEAACHPQLPAPDVALMASNLVKAASTYTQDSTQASGSDIWDPRVTGTPIGVPADEVAPADDAAGRAAAEPAPAEAAHASAAASTTATVVEAVGHNAERLLTDILALIPESHQPSEPSLALVPQGSDIVVSTAEATGDDEYINLPTQEESLSDVDEAEVEKYLLPEAEQENKRLVWDDLMKDVMPVVLQRARERQLKANVAGRKWGKRKEPLPPMENASDAVKAAIKRATNPNYAVNDHAIDELFAT